MPSTEPALSANYAEPRRPLKRESSGLTVSPQEAFLDYEHVENHLSHSGLGKMPSLFASVPPGLSDAKLAPMRASAGAQTPRMPSQHNVPRARSSTDEAVYAARPVAMTRNDTARPHHYQKRPGPSVHQSPAGRSPYLNQSDGRGSASQESGSQSSLFSPVDSGDTISTDDDEDERPYYPPNMRPSMIRGGPSSLYEVASNAQFMPLLYLAAFVTMARGAARLSWFTYGVTVLAYGGLYGLQGPPAGDTIGHFWLMLLVTHPIFILSLSYVSVLHSRLSKAEIEVHAGRERFLAMLSHEIRTPLQGMLGSIDLLDIKVQGAAERRAIDRLRQISAQLTAHLKDLTEYTRMDNPAWRLQPEWVDLINLVEDICDEHLHRIRAKGLHLLVDAEDDPRIREVETDPSRIRQVLDNLLTNALKYTTTGGITVRLKVLEAGDANGPQGPQAPQPTLPCIQMEVVDTGVGIADEAMARVFEPYVRLEDRKLPRTEGTGLGLAVVRRLVDRLGGSMAVESAPDQGTRFLIWLPMQPLARQ